MGTDLRHIPLFAGLSDAELDAIAAHAVLRSFPRHAVVVNEGDTSRCLYVIASGEVKVFLADEEGREVIINMLEAGDHFGELALLDDAPRSASVMTLTTTTLYLIPKAGFDACLAQNPLIAAKLLRGLAQRVRDLSENIRTLALLDVYGRIAKMLSQLAAGENGIGVVEQRLTHQDIARMVGASREMVSRILRDLSVGGYIRNENQRITLLKKLPSAW